MMTRFKGAGRYYPGCIYGFILAFPVMLIILLMFGEAIMENEVIGLLLYVAAVVILYFLGCWVGKKIYGFTERKFSETPFFCERLEMWAFLTEFAVSGAVFVLTLCIAVLLSL